MHVYFVASLLFLFIGINLSANHFSEIQRRAEVSSMLEFMILQIAEKELLI